MEDYRPIDRQLIDACREYPPDFIKIKNLLDQGADVNATSVADENQCLLSEVIYRYPELLELRAVCCERCDDEDCNGCELDHPDADGRYLPLIIQFFLEHGFDAKGRMGAVCLQNLTWSSDDRYILDACNLLMAAGADPGMVPYLHDSNETVISWVATKASAAKCCDNDLVTANLFRTMYRMMDEKIKSNTSIFAL